MVKVVEGLIGGFREQRNRSGPKIKDAPNRLLNPEKHFKQRKLEKGKKKTVLSAQSYKTTFVFALYTFAENVMLHYVLENVGRNITQRKFYDHL